MNKIWAIPRADRPGLPGLYGRSLARVIVMLPWAVSLTMTAIVWRWALSGESGMLNSGLLSRALTDWLEDPARLRRLTARFSTMVQPGDTVTCRVTVAGFDEAAEAGADQGRLARPRRPEDEQWFTIVCEGLPPTGKETISDAHDVCQHRRGMSSTQTALDADWLGACRRAAEGLERMLADAPTTKAGSFTHLTQPTTHSGLHCLDRVPLQNK